MKILILDDEADIRETLGKKLENEGYDVFLESVGLSTLKTFHKKNPELVILDIVVPGEMDGLTVCRRIREISDVPIMMLSANAIREADIIEGLNAGADEYLIKPIRLNEFAARVRAILRRVQTMTDEPLQNYNDGYLSINVQKRIVHVEDRRIHLTPTEFKLLTFLLEHAGHVVTQRTLLEQVWGTEYIDDVYYPRVYISQLRKKIEQDPTDPIYIQTEHRIGYRFEKQLH